MSDLPPGAMRVIEHAGTSVLLCNVGGDFYAVENVCSHAAVPLSEGELDGCELECVLHGAVFDVRTGDAIALPAREGIKSFPVEREGNRVRIRV